LLLFLGEDEVGSLTVSDVNDDITIVKPNGNTEGISFQIKGMFVCFWLIFY
jgi:hypothetical protein